MTNTKKIFSDHGIVDRADIHYLHRRLCDFDYLTKEWGLKAGPAARISAAVVSDCNWDPGMKGIFLLARVDELTVECL